MGDRCWFDSNFQPTKSGNIWLRLDFYRVFDGFETGDIAIVRYAQHRNHPLLEAITTVNEGCARISRGKYRRIFPKE